MKFKKFTQVGVGQLFMCLLFVFSSCLFAQDWQVYNRLLPEMGDAYRNHDFSTAIQKADSLLEFIPSHLIVHYRLFLMHSANENTKKAYDSFKKMIQLGCPPVAANDSSILKFRKFSDFEDVTGDLKETQKHVNNSTQTFVLKERDLIPESICFDPVDDVFYLGSIYKCKIIKVDRNGKVSDFTREKQDGLRTVLGMKVDPDKRILWACSMVDRTPPPGVDSTEVGWSGLFAYDLDTGKLIKKVTLFEKGVMHLFNDLAFCPNGDIFISDSEFGAVYRLPYGKDGVELFLKSKTFGYPNGIAVSPVGNNIYLANSRTEIFMIDVKTKNVSHLVHPDNFSTYGIDGLYWHDGSLIAIQNNGFLRVSRYYLNQTGNHIDSFEILEANNPIFNVPTTGVVAGNQFYFIANCHLRAFNPDGSLNRDKLTDIQILKVNL